MKTYMFMYILADEIDKIKKNLGQHVGYWKGLDLEYFKNGPFADKSGGLIIFSAADDDAAEEIISRDPILFDKTVDHYWLKEWVA